MKQGRQRKARFFCFFLLIWISVGELWLENRVWVKFGSEWMKVDFGGIVIGEGGMKNW